MQKKLAKNGQIYAKYAKYMQYMQNICKICQKYAKYAKNMQNMQKLNMLKYVKRGSIKFFLLLLYCTVTLYSYKSLSVILFFQLLVLYDLFFIFLLSS